MCDAEEKDLSHRAGYCVAADGTRRGSSTIENTLRIGAEDAGMKITNRRYADCA